MSTTEHPPEGTATTERPDWETVQASPEFQALRSRFRRFVFPLTFAFLAWYLLYVLLATYATGFMSIKIGGNFTVGLLFGLLQFVSTFAITMWYVRFADRKLDPHAAALREEIEREGGK